METLIGMWIVDFAIIIACTLLFGDDLDTKEKIKLIIGATVFMTLIFIGSYLITGGK